MSNVVAELFASLGLQTDAKSFDRGDHVLGHLKKTIVEIGAAFLSIEAVKGLAEMVHGISETADHAVKAGREIGVTTEAIQELGYAASMSGVSQEELEISLTHLARGLDEVKKGTGPAADAFAALGISASQVKNLSLDKTLGLVADKFAKMPDGQRKLAMTLDLFGRSGAKMIPMLDKGAAGIAGMRTEAEELGGVIGGETAESFEKLNEDGNKLSWMWRGMKVQFASELLPELHKLVTSFMEWAKAHREVIRSGISEAVRVVTAVLEGMAAAVRGVLTALSWLSEHAEAAKVLLGGLAIAALALAAPFIAATAEVLVIGGAIAALGAGLVWLADHWDRVTSAIGGAIKAMGSWIAKQADAVLGFGHEGDGGFGDIMAKIRKQQQGPSADDQIPGFAHARGALGADALHPMKPTGESDDDSNLPAMYREPSKSAPTRDAGATAMNAPQTNNTITGNTIKIDVSGAASPTETASTIKGHLDDYFGTILRTTNENA